MAYQLREWGNLGENRKTLRQKGTNRDRWSGGSKKVRWKWRQVTQLLRHRGSQLIHTGQKKASHSCTKSFGSSLAQEPAVVSTTAGHSPSMHQETSVALPPRCTARHWWHYASKVMLQTWDKIHLPRDSSWSWISGAEEALGEISFSLFITQDTVSPSYPCTKATNLSLITIWKGTQTGYEDVKG